MDKMINRKFGRLKVIKEISPPPDIKYAAKIGKWYECECRCGNIIPVPKVSLLNHNVSSCGCLRSEVARETLMKTKNKMAEEGIIAIPKSKIRYLEYQGQIKSMSAWAKDIGITREALRQRLEKYTTEEALSMKRGKKNGN